MAVLNFIQQVLSTPAIFVGLLALLGLALQKKDAQTMVKGTIKTILGFIVLNAGASVVQQAIIPFGDLFQLAFGVQGVVPNNEAITSLGLTDYAVQTASIFALGMCANIVLARFSKWKYIFLTGHHALYMSCLIAIILNIAGFDGWMLIVGGALLLGFVMSLFPALMQPLFSNSRSVFTSWEQIYICWISLPLAAPTMHADFSPLPNWKPFICISSL